MVGKVLGDEVVQVVPRSGTSLDQNQSSCGRHAEMKHGNGSTILMKWKRTKA